MFAKRPGDPSGCRPAVVAGTFYPGHAAALERAVHTYLDEADVPELPPVHAVIAPHAGYQYSGPVAGFSFKALAGLPDVEYTVYLMGPAHRWPVNGVGLSSADTFETPLGPVPVATDRVAQLLAQGDPYHSADRAHAPEHCLEVELPFLQTVLRRFRIVPMLLDEGADPARVGDDLAQTMIGDSPNLMVVSSDLSHFYPYELAVRLDRSLLDALSAGDTAAVSKGEACGLIPILCLMVVARTLAWTPHVLHYANSGDTGGFRQEVVGYGAVAYAG